MRVPTGAQPLRGEEKGNGMATEMQRLPCREHGGIFLRTPTRGRKPVSCSTENPCNRAKSVQQHGATSRRLRAAELAEAVESRREVPAKKPSRNVPAASSTIVRNNPSIPLAHEAKRLLEPQGWQLAGKAWYATDEETGKEMAFSSVLGRRGEEVISFLWCNARLVSQNYSMWNSDKPSENGMPKKRLDFDPDDMSDVALIKRLSGRKVWWWNKLGKSAESATMPHGADKRIKVEHLMDGNGQEEARIISFVDQSGTGFRDFNVGALLKVNS